jgi:hypothetical protein
MMLVQAKQPPGLERLGSDPAGSSAVEATSTQVCIPIGEGDVPTEQGDYAAQRTDPGKQSSP